MELSEHKARKETYKTECVGRCTLLQISDTVLDQYLPSTDIRYYSEENLDGVHLEKMVFTTNVNMTLKRISRKRLKKLLMSKGNDRNTAEWYLEKAVQCRRPYSEFWIRYLIFGTNMVWLKK